MLDKALGNREVDTTGLFRERKIKGAMKIFNNDSIDKL